MGAPKKVRSFTEQKALDDLKTFVEHHLVPIKDISNDISVTYFSHNLYSLTTNIRFNRKDIVEMLSELSEFCDVISKTYEVSRVRVDTTGKVAELTIDYSSKLEQTIDFAINRFFDGYIDTIKSVFKGNLIIDEDDDGLLGKMKFTFPSTPELKSKIEIKFREIIRNNSFVEDDDLLYLTYNQEDYSEDLTKRFLLDIYNIYKEHKLL